MKNYVYIALTFIALLASCSDNGNFSVDTKEQMKKDMASYIFVDCSLRRNLY